MINILLADDQRLVCEGLGNLLKLQEDLCIVGVAHNGREAINLAQSLNPDILLLDIQMPEMDGLEAASHLHDMLPYLKILVLTTFKSQDYLIQALSVGVKGYILKNTPPNEIAQAIRSVYRGYSYFSPGIMEQLVPILDQYHTSTNAVAKYARSLTHNPDIELENEQSPTKMEEAFTDTENRASKTLSKTSSKADSFKLDYLTPRELEIMKLIGQGYANREISRLLGISEQTVKNHVSSILRRLQLRDRTQVALWASRIRSSQQKQS